MSYGHQTAAGISNTLGETVWNASYSFSFIRNPWSRTLSIYNMLYDQNSVGSDHFKQFLRVPCFQTYSRGLVQPWKPQTDFICSGGGQIVNFVGRFERLKIDWAMVAMRLGLPKMLEHLNRGKHVEDYRDYYDAEGRDLVARYLAADIEFGEYRF